MYRYMSNIQDAINDLNYNYNFPPISKLIKLVQSKYTFSKDEILKTVWGDDVVVGDRTIDVHVRKLREKLGDEYIKTVKGVGYKFDF